MADDTAGNRHDLEAITGLVIGQAAATDAMTSDVAARIAASWLLFDDWYASARIGELVRVHAQWLAASKRGVANLTNAYLSRATTEVVGRRVQPVKLVDVDAVRWDPFTSAPMQENARLHVLGRPADAYRFAVSNGLDTQQALDDVVARAEAIVQQEHMLVQREQEAAFMENASIPGTGTITGYRRVIHPELSVKSGVCGLCIAAADREVYHKPSAKLPAGTQRGQLRELHTGCNCTVLPIIGGEDPGQELNGRDLGNLYRLAGSTYADDLIRVRVKAQSHGELGPVLTAALDDFTSQADVRRHTNTRRLPGEHPGSSQARGLKERAARQAAGQAAQNPPPAP